MRNRLANTGFSLVEILVSLFIVSFTALNIVGLQKMIGDQSRDNFSHSAVITLVSEKLEELMLYDDMANVDALSGTTATYTQRATDFDLSWRITTVLGASNSAPIREVSVTVTWPNALGNMQSFTYSEQISFAMLSYKESTFPYTIANLLGTDQVGYFESGVSYQKHDYVIYDSKLFQANSGNPNTLIDSEGKVSIDWKNLGLINNEQLASLFSD